MILQRISVAKGPKFRPQSSKRAEKNLVGPGKSGAELMIRFIKKGPKKGQKKGRKGAELFYVCFSENYLFFLP
jgi:hypothetical protein